MDLTLSPSICWIFEVAEESGEVITVFLLLVMSCIPAQRHYAAA